MLFFYKLSKKYHPQKKSNISDERARKDNKCQIKPNSAFCNYIEKDAPYMYNYFLGFFIKCGP